MKTPKINQPWSRIDAIMNACKEPQGPEWFTLEQFALRYGLSYGRARAEIKKLRPKLKSWKGVLGETGRTTCKFRFKA